MPTLSEKELRENRAPIAKIIRDLSEVAIAEGRDFTAEEQEQYDKANKEYNDLTRSIDFASRAEKVMRDQEETIEEQRERDAKNRRDKAGRDDVNHRDSATRGEHGREPEKTTDRHRDIAVRAWAKAQFHIDLSSEESDACTRTGVRPHDGELRCSFRSDYRSVLREYRSQITNTDTAGGYLVPPGFINSLELALLQFGGVRMVADVLRTETGANISWPTSNDTSNRGRLIGETVAVTETAVTFAQVIFQAFKYSSDMVQVSHELLRDSVIDLPSILGRMLGERIGRITNLHFTTGDGAAKPKGIVTASVLGKTAASATAVAADELFDLVHSVDPAYRSGPGVGWMMHDNILLAIRKLKDGNGQYLWQPGLSMGEPDRILGYPVTINQDMASSIASGNKSMLFGALNKYKIRDVAGFRMRRLVERYADQDQDGFFAVSEHDGNLIDAGTNPVKHMVH